MLTNAREYELKAALAAVNKRYGGNIIFNRHPEAVGTHNRFTLKVKSSHGPGARVTGAGRHIACACWHVHGYFFEELFKLNPGIWIATGGNRITSTDGNWRDRNIGSIMEPLMHSQACECLER